MVCDEKAILSTYRTIQLSSSIHLFLLDSRRGYLGKHQAKQLRSDLQNSKAMWKIVLYGTAFGIETDPNKTDYPPVIEDEMNRLNINMGNEKEREKEKEKEDVDEDGRPLTRLVTFSRFLSMILILFSLI